MDTIFNNLRKISILVLAFGILSFPYIISAQATGCSTVICNPLGQTGDLGTFLVSLLNQLSKIAAMLAVLMIIYSGLQFVLARGNEGKITKAKSQLLYVVIGTAIVLGADVIINIVVNTISGIKSS
jgi:hypothetical protein